MDIEQEFAKLVTPTRAARLKGMPLNSFKYRVRKDGAPRPVFVGEDGDIYYYKTDILAWKPAKRKARGS